MYLRENIQLKVSEVSISYEILEVVDSRVWTGKIHDDHGVFGGIRKFS
jgi:hypothetical protein